YSGPLPVRIRGPLHADALVRGLDEIVRRHEILRTGFEVINREPAQVIWPDLRLQIDQVDLCGRSGTEAEIIRLAGEDARQPFDLAEPPLLRTKLIRTAADEHVLLLNVHHIVFDGWSAGVLL